ncbi:hypothetical protein CDCA_CDCA04G1411 [Cyanidium caldarium]|uniref:Pseudouridine synthase I TruA alpha/beta domain-containing protein n=1 Tax=Cyanidium caldarium TaxID=2771 RepID=A0AAV9IT83_CYACA|nr:hypothetical protein CDCA_CDCA04G1411 [Cyanidium caldarium]
MTGHLARMTRPELEAYAAELERRLGGVAVAPRGAPLRRQRPPQREIDFRQYGVRQIALKLSYEGWAFTSGFAAQPGDFAWRTSPHREPRFPSVESALFFALERVRLVPPLEQALEPPPPPPSSSSSESALAVSPNRAFSAEKYGEAWAHRGWRYSRGGRTDKGVSALGQVVSLQVRARDADDSTTGDYDYALLLNKVLPESVRIYAWAPVPTDFSARFSACSREYRYAVPAVFPATAVERMQEAAACMVGRHDFVNFCKYDAENTRGNTERVVLACRVEPHGAAATWPRGLLSITVEAQAFLYHQVRCMVAVLLEVGRGTETVDTVRQLLNADPHAAAVDRKPQYAWAPETPLVLWDVRYGEREPPWRLHANASSETESSRRSVRALRESTAQQWYAHACRTAHSAALLERALQATRAPTEADAQTLGIQLHDYFPCMVPQSRHTPLMQRSVTGLNRQERQRKAQRLLQTAPRSAGNGLATATASPAERRSSSSSSSLPHTGA